MDKKIMTAFNSSVGADEKQSTNNLASTIITENDENINDFYPEKPLNLMKFMEPGYLNTVSMPQLYEMISYSKPPLIDGLLYPGLYIFAGAPKLGKSFLMTQLSYHISMGINLWGFNVKQGKVLYLALEDDYGRLQSRLYRMFGTDVTENLFFAVSAGKTDDNLLEQLEGFVKNNPDTVLIIIDTLQMVRESGNDRYSYSGDYEVIAKLKKFADRNNICLILVHHTRKQQADDKFDMISGTNGLMGAADGAIVMQKEKRTGDRATLDISGRDQQDQRLYLVKESEKLTWELESIENNLQYVPAEPILQQIADFITADNPLWSGSPTELAEILKTDLKPNTLSYKLNINAGRLLNEHAISYENIRTHSGRKITFSLVLK